MPIQKELRTTLDSFKVFSGSGLPVPSQFILPTPTDRELIVELLDTMQRLERKIDLVFGNQYLIDGKWINL